MTHTALPAQCKCPALVALTDIPINIPVGIVIPVYDAKDNTNLAQVQFGIEQCCDLPYQLSLGIGPQCVAANRVKGEARLAKAIDIVIHMDDDVVVPPHFASKLVSILMSNEKVGAVSAIMVGPQGERQNDVHPDLIPAGILRDCIPPGTFFAYNRRKTPIKWDTEYKGSQWEDTDAMRQILRQGYRTVATGNVLIMHKNQWSENKWWKENRARFESKWGPVGQGW